MSNSQLNNSESLDGVNGRPWIKSIHIDKIRHLEDFDIPICDDAAPRHLMITGPNGSGKTSLLIAMKNLLEKIGNDDNLLLQCKMNDLLIENSKKDPSVQQSDKDIIAKGCENINHRIELIEDENGELMFEMHDAVSFPLLTHEKKFIIAFYQDSRVSSFKPVKAPVKPDIKFNIQENNGDQFIQFLVDLKIQQALARNEENNTYAAEIEKWFEAFTNILRQLFNDNALSLDFNYKDYSFEIVTSETHFPFTGLSAGYAAILDIVADLILRMQSLDRVTRVFEMPGIALIDEVETHLHLALQKNIMPMLTNLFPKVQFIVSTHSPFVLNSISNATIYDLQNRKCVQNLTEYSYEALAEGYFGVETDSGELKMRLDKLETLLAKTSKTDSDKLLIQNLIIDFEKIPDGIAPAQKTRFYELKRQYLLAGGKL